MGCKMISFDEMSAFQKMGEAFAPFPAWIEINPRYATSAYALHNLLRPVAIQSFDAPGDCEPEVYTSHGNFQMDGYGISWRAWYACGSEVPDCDSIVWGRFLWDKGD